VGTPDQGKFCIACGVALPSGAAFCSACGKPQALDATPQTGAPGGSSDAPAAPSQAEQFKAGCLGCLGILFVVFAGCMALVTFAPKPQPGQEDITADAVTAAQMAVPRYLKSPASAAFPSLLWDRAAWQIVRTSPTTARVSSYVDSQNAFGAMMRSRFTVDIHNSGGRWVASSVEIHPQ
jgi:hypothetical protein